MSDFIHLHAHSMFSFKDALSKPSAMAKRAKELEMPAIALTDHGTMSGLISFYKACNEENVKPILGVEAYYADDLDAENIPYFHVVVLCKNLKGYRSLMQASTRAHTTGAKKTSKRARTTKPLMDWETISNLEDVIITTACVGGILTGDFLHTDYSHDGMMQGAQRCRMFKEKFGDDFYVELQKHASQDEMFRKCNNFAIEFAKDNGIKTVLTNDFHFVNQDDMEAHKLWCADRFKQKLDSFNYVYDDSFFLKDAEQMKLVSPTEEAFHNVMEINDKIDWIDINLGAGYLPHFQSLTPAESNRRFKELTAQALKEFLQANDKNKDEYITRLAEELKFMLSHDFGEYFLHIWNIIKWANDKGILVGPGRGSAGGSLAVNLLNITQLDPIEHGLLFKRFLNPGRVHKKKKWKVELEDGTITDVIEGNHYHTLDECGCWQLVEGQELINGHK